MFLAFKQWLIKMGLVFALEQAQKKIVSNSIVKNVLHAGNAKLAEKVKLEGKEAAVKYGQELMALGQKYIDAWADDGVITEPELKALNDKCDAMVDKYLPDSRLAAWVQTAFEWASDLVDRIFAKKQKES